MLKLIFILFVCAKAPVSLDSYSIQEYSRGESIQATYDGGYVITGYCSELLYDYIQVCLVKLDVIGKIVWSTKIRLGIDDRATTVIESSTKNKYIVTGTSISEEAKGGIMLLQYDTLGNLVSSDVFRDYYNTHGYFVMESNDTGYIMIGDRQLGGTSIRGLHLLKLGNQNVLDLNVTISIGYQAKGLWGKVVSDGYIIAGCITQNSTYDTDALLFKTNNEGGILWVQSYGGKSQDLFYSGTQTDDGGFALIGTTSSFGAGQSDVYLVKTNANGNKEWNMTYGGSSFDKGYSIVQVKEGGYAIAGVSSSFGDWSLDAYFIKTSIDGTKEYQQTFGNYLYYDEAKSITQAKGGDLGITGTLSISPTKQTLFIRIFLCPQGTYQSGDICIDCPAGSYNNLRNSSNASDCISCPPGYYSMPGAAVCKECPIGSYNEAFGSLGCLDCPAGTYGSNLINTSSSSHCLLCPNGTVNLKSGATNISSCVSCPQAYQPSSNRDYCMHIACHPFCEDCYGITSSECYSCNHLIPSLIMANKTCVCDRGYYQTTISGEITCSRIF